MTKHLKNYDFCHFLRDFLTLSGEIKGKDETTVDSNVFLRVLEKREKN